MKSDNRFMTGINQTVIEGLGKDIFSASTVRTAGNMTSPVFSLYNPSASVYLAILKVSAIVYPTGAAVVLNSLGYGYNTNQFTNPGGSQLTVTPTFLGSSKVAQGKAYSSATLSSAPQTLQHVFNVGVNTTNQDFSSVAVDYVNGAIIVPQNCVFSAGSMSGNISLNIGFTVLWKEIPVNIDNLLAQL